MNLYITIMLHECPIYYLLSILFYNLNKNNVDNSLEDKHIWHKSKKILKDFHTNSFL